jgi:hypothetical protein
MGTRQEPIGKVTSIISVVPAFNIQHTVDASSFPFCLHRTIKLVSAYLLEKSSQNPKGIIA